MYKGKKITIYFPCRNESNSLETIKARIPEFVDEAIIVSNKSTDNTLEKALELGFKAIKDDRTSGGIGYGFAHMSGIANATGDIIIAADGDAQHPLGNLDKIIDYLIDNELDFISCSRYPLTKGEKTSFKQRLGVAILNLEVALLYGIKLNDVLSGMFVFRKEVKNQLELTEGDWNLSPQIKLNAATNKNIRFSEYFISQNKRVDGKTHQQYFKSGLNHLLWIFRNRFGLNKELLLDKTNTKSSLYFEITNNSSEPKLYFELN